MKINAFSVLLLPATIFLSAFLTTGDNHNKKNVIVGSWELTREHYIDSSLNNDSLVTGGGDTIYTHGKSVTLTFRPDNTYVFTDGRPNPDNPEGLPINDSAVYILLPGKLILTSSFPRDDTFNYIVSENIMTLSQSGVQRAGAVAFSGPRKWRRTFTFEKH